MPKQKLEKKPEPVVVPHINKQFSEAIALINAYNQLLNDNVLYGVIKNKTALNEITEFVEERLGTLINFGKTTETFEATEVKMLKNLLKKVGEGPQKVAPQPTNQTNLIEIQNEANKTTAELSPKPLVQEFVSPLVTTQDNLDPIVKEALEAQAQAQEFVQLPRKHKTVDRSPTQKVASSEDINAYARSQAAAANQTKNGVVDVRKLL
jgi:hypothetical protein